MQVMRKWKMALKGCTGVSKEADERKVCAVRYADESVMASIQRWTQPIPQDCTPARTNTHRGTKNLYFR